MKVICGVGIASIFLGMMSFVACGPSATPTTSTTQTPTPEPKKEPVLYTGKSCLSQMAGLAARWAPDALPYHLESTLNAESDGHDGKSTVWQGMFASPTRRTYRTFTCSGSRLPDSPPMGVTASTEQPYSRDVALLLFQLFQLTIDTDQVYTLAQEKGGSKLMEKNPKQPVLYFLDWDNKNKQLLWVVVYGDSGKDSKGKGVIDATTGKFLRAG